MAALLVSRHRKRLEPYYRHSLPSREAVETLSDKVSFYRFAQDNGFPIPKTRFLYSRDEVEEVAGSLSFPLVLKPPNSKSPQWLEQTKIKAFRVETAAQLIELHAIYGRLVSPLIVQEWVEGPETELYACHGFFDDNSQPLATFTSRKIRQWPPGVGQACLAEEVQDEQVRQITLDVFRRINFRGLGYMEVKRDVRSGQYLIVEPNIGRVSGRMAIAEAGGVELLYTMYCHAVGLPLPEGRIQKFVGAKWIYLRQDVQSSLFYLGSGELSLRQWWKTVQGQKRFALFSWRDPGPFVGDIIAGLKLLLDPRRRRRRTVRRTAEKPLQQASTL
jgi:predicted ATP-grasp superfamily ATP-dependent carboligase